MHSWARETKRVPRSAGVRPVLGNRRQIAVTMNALLVNLHSWLRQNARAPKFLTQNCDNFCMVRVSEVYAAHRSSGRSPARPPRVNFWWKISLSAQKVITRSAHFPPEKLLKGVARSIFPRLLSTPRAFSSQRAPLYDPFPSRPSGWAAYCVCAADSFSSMESCGGGLKSWRNASEC